MRSSSEMLRCVDALLQVCMLSQSPSLLWIFTLNLYYSKCSLHAFKYSTLFKQVEVSASISNDATDNI